MSTKALIPGNSQRTRQTALNVFGRFAEDKKMTVNDICELVGGSIGGHTSSKDYLLSKNSVSSYFENVKNHLLEMFPTLHAESGRRHQKIASVLDKYCSKRCTDFTNQAAPCTKRDLRGLCTSILPYATTAEGYKDCALLNFLWYLLGRSSDIIGLMKNQVAVYPGGCLAITCKRMKSAATHGASFFYDPINLSPCPLHSLDIALIMQTTSSEFLLDQVPRDYFEVQPISVEDTSFRKLIENPRDVSIYMNTSQSAVAPEATQRAVVPRIHAYVNRILGYLLTHSFRRGGAQNANGDSNVSSPWILDRGGWSMSAVSKAFNYIVTSTHEDKKWANHSPPQLPTPEAVDAPVLQRIRQVQCLLFGFTLGLDDSLILRTVVIEILGAVTILHHNEMMHLAPAVSQSQVTEPEISGWALTIQESFLTSKRTAQRISSVKSKNEGLGQTNGASKTTNEVDQRLNFAAFMRVFLPDGYNVTGCGPDAKSRILLVGREAEGNIRAFMAAENIDATARGIIDKALTCRR
ncbi:hypothetical protein PHMEG_0003536 [Phytophthora megakarya]|uniref:Uncharacterized protein n=1 Tax=Phytophthora megakarya TaxID=4795 RepID=A0A225WXX2_9STRA|nr:hypothetical protein PHMEG_0003536 [Phytophthora megakarya]